MQFLHYAPFFCLFAGVAFGGSLIIINNYNQCMVWSESNYGYTGYSAPFARLDGEDCLSFTVNGTHVGNEMLKVNICGTEDGRQVAWVKVNKDGTVSFLNKQGTIASCSLDNDLKVGGKCSIIDIEHSPSATVTSVTRQTSASTLVSTQSGSSASAELVPSTLGSSSVVGCSCNLVNM